MEDLVRTTPRDSRRPAPDLWRNRRVLVTGHTGFKGSWLCLLLSGLGANVSGFALPQEPGPTAFDLLGVADHLQQSQLGDLRDTSAVAAAVREANPEIVLHLAAQAVVGRGYRDPAGTFATNVTGTINLLEALRAQMDSLAAAVIVTSDKVYRNDGTGQAFRETDPLGGGDPYSASKAACEIAVASYAHSFAGALPPLATARAGNVIGGGDFGEDRLIPDLFRAERAGQPLLIRRPDATRPFQHVLDVLCGYLLLAEDLTLRSPETPRAVNFGPEDREMSVRDVLGTLGRVRGRPVEWRQADPQAVYAEAPRLAIDASLARQSLRWEPRLKGDAIFTETAAWYEAWLKGETLRGLSERAIERAITP
ncbi:CDP-glucose 4,6-dehydratase [Microvirga alba]|uniref:CDP-glucose 4,6-dehydratase n=1 Tax=Microvirga alba TaxID=2791025 RepID=A0A931FMT7_9HYPH|nr:CDP-glucose 4,6-dehydratase [Microvirga alba]MBF9232925.1 CDP-glucose 4,6-dehydratase [Microvirga alba]